MPRFNVHLYPQYRVKFADIEAPNAQDAIKIAVGMHPREAVEVEWAEGPPIEYACDPLLPDGSVDYDHAITGECDPEGNIKSEEGFS